MHLWLSVFQPGSFTHRVLPRLLESQIFNQELIEAPLSSTSTLGIYLCQETRRQIAKTLVAPPLDVTYASTIWKHLMTPVERADYRDRAYGLLEPSHRLAIDEWKHSGVVLPFGVQHTHMDLPNRWIFNEEGLLPLNDGQSPMQGFE